jgi:hypothetical protein
MILTQKCLRVEKFRISLSENQIQNVSMRRYFVFTSRRCRRHRVYAVREVPSGLYSMYCGHSLQ